MDGGGEAVLEFLGKDPVRYLLHGDADVSVEVTVNDLAGPCVLQCFVTVIVLFLHG